MTLMRRTKPRLIGCWACLSALLAFIWINSALPGQTSGEWSGLISRILGSIFPFLSPESENGQHLIRKLAHFSEFAALGMCLMWLFGMLLKKRWPGFLLPFACGVAAAAIDETIQIFSPGRYSSIVDVAIDSAGVLTGVGAALALHWIFSRLFSRKSLQKPPNML